MNPTVSRIVHYVAPGSADGTYPPAHRAAVITETFEDPVDGEVRLCVFNPTGIHFVLVPYDENHAPYTWHWPERED